jgi:ring-1,2-phenylacetyl-CoA epoxidase subunit PaaC
LFQLTEADKEMLNEGIGVDVTQLKADYYNQLNDVLNEATIGIPEVKFFQKGGKEGVHTEHMGYILAEMQYMQRAYPNMEW